MAEQNRTKLTGHITVPGDKSISHRSIIFAAISTGVTTIDNFLKSADCLSTMQAFKDLGVKIDERDGQVVVTGVGLKGLTQSNQPLDMGNSGTSTRLITGLLAGQDFDSTLVGDASLSKRPMARVTDPLSQMGADFTSTENHLPLTVFGRSLHEIHYRLPVASAQVKSAIILAALQATGNTVIEEPTASRDHTERMLAAFSPASIDREDHKITIHPGHPLIAQHVTVPGDISSAAFWLVAGAIVPGSSITIENVGINQTRTGILSVLQQMGAQLSIQERPQANEETEPSADITITASALKPFEIGAEEIPALVDEVPLLALLAARADGVSRITGAEELRFKESDRLAVVAEEFRKLGIAIEELPDGFVIDGHKSWQVQNTDLDSHQDHRIAMTLKIASLLVPEDVTIRDFNAVNISYPSFLADLQRLRS
ncbi:3-phosphoshikimate 1-carboxyvinyltransferase [Fructobacillus cardui]|jgi:3-phosphoshikimate 1-carboxyvinyltransferase|uniref:3-phosphoshikimate 1-carboxyvinyltransferase n=1 Tax=Fructobacillus cardui TaxID=2893170 RepID=UPI00259549F7|nr:3-phosphoshikimate 1-carboxyvinyltransferase [uncultured Fructobacillus sp.]CAK1226587.1 5-enolpyruvylshikimate-3-phosphate synthase (AroA) [Fructobacillus cardui]CAK1233330.1 5-enolpyruvylshikimate-3-phosphate synthase (AroA) [Fructobacillus cardui]